MPARGIAVCNVNQGLQISLIRNAGLSLHRDEYLSFQVFGIIETFISLAEMSCGLLFVKKRTGINKQ